MGLRLRRRSKAQQQLSADRLLLECAVGDLCLYARLLPRSLGGVFAKSLTCANHIPFTSDHSALDAVTRRTRRCYHRLKLLSGLGRPRGRFQSWSSSERSKALDYAVDVSLMYVR